MTMAKPNVLNPHPPEFERFLYASVGEDRNGYVVTVLSTLARLGLDPWKETAELVTLGHDAARARLGTLLARFRDVPTLASDHGRVARDLSHLLPEGPTPGAMNRATCGQIPLRFALLRGHVSAERTGSDAPPEPRPTLCKLIVL